jgi:hypothetical protein
METDYIDFFNRFEKEYELIKHASSDIILASAEIISLIDKKLKVINRWLIEYNFETKEQEIHFFKELKPSLIAKLIFHKSILKISTSLPPSKKDKKKLYQKAILKITEYTINNKSFYEYYRAKSSFNDLNYFTRHTRLDLLHDECYLINHDTRYCSPNEYKVAKFIANDMLTIYLESKIDELNGVTPTHSPITNSPLNWTASKVDLVELIYGLKFSGAINTGNTDVKELAFHFGKLFNIDIDESIYRTYTDIKARKNLRTKFLNTISESLNFKLNEEDY